MLNLILVVIALGLIITIHELGHYLVARFFKVEIEAFSVGFGKPIAEFERGGTKYRISWIPLGGYVKMKGENPDEEIDEGQDDGSFRAKSWWKRALIIFAGPFANLLLGILLFIFALLLPQKMEDVPAIVHSAQGLWEEHFSPGDHILDVDGEEVLGFSDFLVKLTGDEPNEIRYEREGETFSLMVEKAQRDSLMSALKPAVNTVVGEVFSGMPAWRAGVKEGDEIVAVDSVQVSDWYEMRSLIMGSPHSKVELLIRRGDEEFIRNIDLEENISMQDQRMIGISYYMPIKSTHKLSLGEALIYGPASALNFVAMNYQGIFMLIKKPEQLKSSVGGPVMIASMSTQMASRGLSSLILFLGSISLILMVMNLLPIPILDGGHILFAILEGIFRRPVPLKVQEVLQMVGFALLIMLMVFAFYSDISKLLYRFIYTR